MCTIESDDQLEWLHSVNWKSIYLYYQKALSEDGTEAGHQKIMNIILNWFKGKDKDYFSFSNFG